MNPNLVYKLEAKIMKKSFIYVLSGALCILSACNKEIEKPEENQESSGEKKMVTELVSVKSENDGNETKVSIDGSSRYHWTINDYMGYFITNNEGATYTKATSSAYDTKTGKFTLTYEEGYTRGGFGVIPASFAKSFEGGTLTVTYPDSYDISADITAGHYDNRGTYIPVPMVAVNSGDNMTFYSIGALVKVTMSNIPVGTKKLYITFNQVVTGDFEVKNPGTSDPTVSVNDANKSTVAITISESGITAEQATHSFVLYIPVPTTTDLSIASSTTTKAEVLRNKGYAWAVDAITFTGNKGYFATNDGTYIVAPGNLLAYNNGESIEYSFLSGNNGLDQLKSVWGTLDIPHKSSVEPAPATPGLATLPKNNYQDVFTWLELNAVFGNGVTPTAADIVKNGENYAGAYRCYISPNTKRIEDENWMVPDTKIMEGLILSYESGHAIRRIERAIVHTFLNATVAKVLVDVSDSPYESFANHSGWTAEKTTVAGALLFPDGYVDQTDAVTLVDYASMYQSWDTDDGLPGNKKTDLIISYSSFEKMVAAGAIFLPAVGIHSGTTWGQYGDCVALNHSDVYSNDNTSEGTVCNKGTNIPVRTPAVNAYRPLDRFNSVRLVRKVTVTP